MKKSVIATIIAAGALLAACGQNSNNHNGATTQAGAPASPGKQLFAQNCTQCHSATHDMTGPKLAGVLSRWGSDTAALIAFVKNAAESIKTGGPASHAGKLYEEWHQIAMPSFSGLSDAEIMKILRHADQGQD